jgi:N-acetylneuraminic acid mutarotase
MFDKAKQFEITLRYTSLISICAFGLLSIIGCGGGGGGGGTTGPPAAAPCGPVMDIAPASTTNGALASGDCTVEALFPGSGDMSFVDQFRITLPSRGRLTIHMNSTQFDTFLVLLNSPLQLPEIATDDDSGGGTNSLISVDLDAGTYIILANSALVGPVTGAYTLMTTFGPAWIPTSLTLAPDARTGHTAVWIGSEMIVWGGFDPFSGVKNTGARFNPATNTWTPIATAGAPAARYLHTAIWTGMEMIVWGGVNGAGALNDGAKYNPQTDTWTPVTAVATPSARLSHTAVWTGTEMIVWGGFSFQAGTNDQLDTGARYTPVTDTWTPTATAGAPSARALHTAVWTGSKMIVWGGSDDAAPGPPNLFNSGGIYDPATNTWVATNLVGAPPPTRCHSAVWTGAEMIVFGGQTNTNFGCGVSSTTTGSRYDPAADSWSPISAAPASLNISSAPTVWSGTQMITCCESGGARYTPVSDSWNGISPSQIPSVGTKGHSLVWTGANMIAWGGDTGGVVTNVGGIYDPSIDSTP